jgi:hypothetical protein
MDAATESRAQALLARLRRDLETSVTSWPWKTGCETTPDCGLDRMGLIEAAATSRPKGSTHYQPNIPTYKGSL